MSATHYELFYFPSPGLSETIRILLEYGKVEWSERNPTNWQEEKLTTPFGFLPVLTERDQDGSEYQLCESHAIQRYLARKFDLLGSNEREAGTIDSFTEGWKTMLNALIKSKHAKTDEIKEVALADFETAAEHIIKYHGAQLTKNANGYYVGSKLSLVDIHAYAMIQITHLYVRKIFDLEPFNKLCKNIENDPVIGAYVKERLSAYKI
ncbi:hypothetical protein K7432_016439 [Basidiobolus ranarum]|uniref:GST N-terminal domain-containing protein n=1 Tax=Basidiobolus ranarum TaxID=34480 RepID=A0ABR2WEQ0_9FUNG